MDKERYDIKNHLKYLLIVINGIKFNYKWKNNKSCLESFYWVDKPVWCVVFLSFFHRFSLLLLEPNEIYFEDFLVNLINEEPSDDINVLDEQTYIGHLKMCSKSIVFDPKNLELPLIKIAYKNCSRIFIWPGKVNGIESNVLAISCDQYTEMLAKSIVAPYTFKMESRTFLFNFQYAKVYEYLDQLRQLHRASKLHVCEQNDMVKFV